jgi:endonuclease/exonuclease/phosphatase family metal-dependent hydrolase
MRIASFNVENFFSRVRAMNGQDTDEGRVILNEYAKLNARIAKETYTAPDKQAMIASLLKLGLERSDESAWAILRQNHGRLVKRSAGAISIVAKGRGDWIGWVDLKKESVNEIATQMTAKVIHEIGADILAVVEAEDRTTLTRFNTQLLRAAGAEYSQIMLIDGNDERGIDVGLMTRPGHLIESIVSHVDDLGEPDRIFSRDCPEFRIRVGNDVVLVLVNHLKSKGFGIPAESNARRKAQAKRIREIYDSRRAEGVNFIVIVGDMNDTPDSDPLSPLLANGSDLKDITQHPNFESDVRPGTFKNGTASNKIDYVLLSPALFEKVTGGRIFRKGVWGGVNGTIFPHFDEMTAEIHAASDHAAIYADIDL